MTEEPIRWLDDPSIAASLRTDLARGASATATGVDYAATLNSLRAAIAAPAGTLAPAAGAAGSKLGVKVAAVMFFGASAVGSWFALRTPTADAPTVAVGDTAVVAAPVLPDVVRAPTEVAPAPPADPVRASSAIAGPPAVDSTPPAEEPRPVAEVRKVARGPAKNEADHLREARLLADARKSLARDPANTLALTRTLAREFPKGSLVEERLALGIRALAALGRMDEARQQAAAFLATHSDGPHAAAVRRATEADAPAP